MLTRGTSSVKLCKSVSDSFFALSRTYIHTYTLIVSMAVSAKPLSNDCPFAYAELHIASGRCIHYPSAYAGLCIAWVTRVHWHTRAASGHLERLCKGLDLISQPFAQLCLVMRFFHKRMQLSSSCQGLLGCAPFLQIYHVPALLHHAVWLVGAVTPLPLEQAC